MKLVDEVRAKLPVWEAGMDAEQVGDELKKMGFYRQMTGGSFYWHPQFKGQKFEVTPSGILHHHHGKTDPYTLEGLKKGVRAYRLPA